VDTDDVEKDLIPFHKLLLNRGKRSTAGNARPVITNYSSEIFLAQAFQGCQRLSALDPLVIRDKLGTMRKFLPAKVVS
jgi:hypothetical protein